MDLEDIKIKLSKLIREVEDINYKKQKAMSKKTNP